LDFNVQTGLLTASFTSLDPATGQAPTAVIAGFLPPNDSSGIGEGFVQYTVAPKSLLATGTQVNAQASIVFDTNDPLSTPVYSNTLDPSPPISSVAALPVFTPATTFPVSWAGRDATGGNAVASYDVFVSTDGGTFLPWLSGTTQTTATFSGAGGHTYAFCS